MYTLTHKNFTQSRYAQMKNVPCYEDGTLKMQECSASKESQKC